MTEYRPTMMDAAISSHLPGLGRSSGQSLSAAADGEYPARGSQGEIERLRQEVQQLRDRQRQVMELIDCKTPERLIHDLRNLLNEMQLLRLLSNIDQKS